MEEDKKMKYGYAKTVSLSFDKAIEKAKEELQKEGFGILTEIDVKATLKKKLNIDYNKYMILGACNPNFAHKALESEKEIGLLMPCNIIIYENDNQVNVSAILPTKVMSIIKNNQLKKIAEQAEEKLKRAINNIN